MLISDPIPITVGENGKVSYRQEDYDASYSSPLQPNEDGSFTITVSNNPGVALPSTGGPGVNLIYLFGIMLTGVAGTGLVMWKRQRESA